MSDIERPDTVGAHRRAETIREAMRGYVLGMDAIAEAYERRDWVALGHASWDVYCEKEFGEQRLKLTRDQREQAVLAFRGAGMSTRAIGAALGVDNKTVRNDLAGAEYSAPAEVRGSDGKTYAPTKDAGPPRGPVEASEPVEVPPSAPAPEPPGFTWPDVDKLRQRPDLDPRAVENYARATENAELVNWRNAFLIQVSRIGSPLKTFTATEVAEKADERLLGELADQVDRLQTFVAEVHTALHANVVKLRSVS